MLGSVSAPAQDLFLKKDGSSAGTKTEAPKKNAPLFLDNSSSAGQKSASSAKPLFLDRPGGSYGPGNLFKPVTKNGKIFALQQKKPDELTYRQKLGLGVEETRLANLNNIHAQSLKAQAQAQAALAKWEADTAAEEARYAAQQAQEEQQRRALEAQPSAAPKKAPVRAAPLKRPAGTEENSVPKPVFNTVR